MKSRIIVPFTSIALALGIVAAVPVSAATGSAPTVTTSASTGMTGTTAVLNGTINPNKLATYWWFQWGTTKNYGTGSPAVLIPAGTTAVSISLTITGLTPNTTYYFRAAGSNARGNKYGVATTFKTLAVTTPPPPPTKVIYLTFDDGPTPGYTNTVLSELKSAGAVATFFEIGQSTYSISGMCPPSNEWPAAPTPSYATCLANASKTSTYGNFALVRQVLAGGNELGTHSWDHPDFANPLLNAAQTATEISQARALQVAITGVDTKLFRFPYFDATSAGLSYLSSQGMTAESDTIDPSDWDTSVTNAQVTAYIMKYAANGAVVDLHDGQDVIARNEPLIGSGKLPLYATSGTDGFLPSLLSQLKAAGYSFGLLGSSSTSSSAVKAQVAQTGAGIVTPTHENVPVSPGNGG
jgi:peptidoglycan/xylan/chitin deacetylase (PgdA/CDA1 family)